MSSERTRQRACDICRRRKRRCDSADRCAHCVKYNFTCTYLEPSPARNAHDTGQGSPSHDNHHVENLKLRLERAEASLREPVVPPPIARAIARLARPFNPPHPDDAGFIDIADSLKALSLESTPTDPGFQGKSSAAALVKAAVAVKQGHMALDYQRPAPKPWTLKPWEGNSLVARHGLSFPEDHSMVSLVSLYFSSVNPLIPLLHRPTFEQCIGRRLHEDEPGFASTVLLVCALGSLYLPEVSRQERETLGWKWYNQVELCGHTLKNLPALYDLQAYCLAAEFLNLTSNPRFCWSIVGFGLRLVEDMGAHRLKSAARPISAEEELEKRAFWVLVLFDSHLSAALGRSAVFDPPGFDMDLPSECDDEYWGISGPGAQPPGIPSSVSFFNSILNLYRIFHFTLRIFYCTTRSHTFMKIRHLWPIATQLGSTLDKWFSSIPQHLIWDPVHPDALFFDQSAALHCFHCYVRILIYRPFLPAVRPGLPTGLAAVSECSEAAQACIQVAETHRRRRPDSPLLFSQTPIFTAAMVLLLKTWGGAPTDDTSGALAYIRTGIDVLKAQQERWSASVFYLSVLGELVSLDHPGTDQAAPHRVDDYIHSAAADNSQSHAPPNWVPNAMNGDVRWAVDAPPVFVGDEEIHPTARFHRPYDIDFYFSIGG